MAKRKRQIEDGVEIDTEAWMLTFSDLLMLLLTFFVLLFTMSSMDNNALKDVLTSLRGSAGVLEFSGLRAVSDLATFVRNYQDSTNIVVVDQSQLMEMLLPSTTRTKEKIQDSVKDLTQFININDDVRGIVVSFQDAILFNSGEAILKKKAYALLDTVARAIESCPHDVLIMGHTDNIPVQSELYDSNWELSAHRGLSVLEYLLKVKKLPPKRFSVGGYGPSRPLHPNDTPENRASNRRVEIIFRHLGEG